MLMRWQLSRDRRLRCRSRLEKPGAARWSVQNDSWSAPPHGPTARRILRKDREAMRLVAERAKARRDPAICEELRRSPAPTCPKLAARGAKRRHPRS